MTRLNRHRWLAAGVAMVLVASACASSRTAGTTTTTAGGSTTTASTTAAAPMFGDTAWPCGPAATGVTNKATEQGVTADSVTIGAGDDAGFTGSPGLSHELTDAMKAFVGKCNDLGGVAGRKVVLDYHDAKLFEVKAAITDACAKDFFMVGEGWAFDDQQEETRVGCKLPAVPGYSVSGAFAMSADQFQGVPNPADETPSVWFKQLATLFPDKIKNVGTLVGKFPATQQTRDKVKEASAKFGFNYVVDLESNPAGESDWTPFVKQLIAAKVTAVYFAGTCTPGYLKFRQTAKANGLDAPAVLFFVDANFYTTGCAKANADGAMDGTYIRSAFIPLEEGSTTKATQDYLDLMKDKGGDISQLGQQSASSFLLWATAASKCGADLTRACVLTNLAATTKWTGHGMHSETNPGLNHGPVCGLLLVQKGTGYQRVTPTDPGKLECDTANGVTATPNVPALPPLKLDANRHAHQYDK